MKVRSLLPDSVWRSDLNSLENTVTSPNFARASISL